MPPGRDAGVSPSYAEPAGPFITALHRVSSCSLVGPSSSSAGLPSSRYVASSCSRRLAADCAPGRFTPDIPLLLLSVMVVSASAGRDSTVLAPE